MYESTQGPVVVLSSNIRRDVGKKVQKENIQAAKTIADVIRSCLGPRAMLKMLMDPTGGIVMTNDGNCILREITVQHPAGKSLIEIARTQDEEVGDGTTSVIILTAEILASAESFLSQGIHPTIIIRAYRRALDDIIEILKNDVSKPIGNNLTSIQVIKACVGTKFFNRWSDLICKMALEATEIVNLEYNNKKDIDIKRYVKVEKIPGGSVDDSYLLKGVLLNKDVTHPRMRRYIKFPRIVLLDASLEYKKGESQTNIEIIKENDFSRMLQLEEDYIKKICADIIAVRPDVVITEKGVSDLAQHYLLKANISVIRRVRKSDSNRISRICGATIVNRCEELSDFHVGTDAGIFEIKSINNEYFCFIADSKNPKACTIILRGASKDILNECERNLQDALHVSKNLMLEPRVVPGGGSVEMAVSKALSEKSIRLAGIEQWPYKAISKALEIIPKVLTQNCGANTVRVLTMLRAKHATLGNTWGVDGETGELIDVSDSGIWEPLVVKLQTYKTAIETAILLLRIDDIVSGKKKKDQNYDGNNPSTSN